jgi:ABC-type nitrate/sulfonate/bicarbonate transport system substrate-binding protein
MKIIIPFLSLLILVAAPCLSATTAKQVAPPGKQPLIESTFAYFPLAVPTSVLGETMRRDRILQKNLARQGVKLNFKPFTKGSDVLPLVRDNYVVGVSMADMPTIEAVAGGDMLIVGFVKQSYSAIVAPHGTQPKELRNKRIGNAYGSTSHYALLQALSASNLSEQNVTLEPLAVNDMLEALESGKIDAFAAWEPTPAAAIKKYPGRYAQIYRQRSYSFFLLSGSMYRTNPAVAREITAALLRAIYWLKKSDANLLTACNWSVDGVLAFTGKPSQLKAEDIALITHDDLLDVAGAPAIPANLSQHGSLLFKEFDFLKQLGKLPANASREKLSLSLKNNILNEVMTAPAKYSLNRFDYAK